MGYLYLLHLSTLTCHWALYDKSNFHECVRGQHLQCQGQCLLGSVGLGVGWAFTVSFWSLFDYSNHSTPTTAPTTSPMQLKAKVKARPCQGQGQRFLSWRLRSLFKNYIIANFAKLITQHKHWNKVSLLVNTCYFKFSIIKGKPARAIDARNSSFNICSTCLTPSSPYNNSYWWLSSAVMLVHWKPQNDKCSHSYLRFGFRSRLV